MIFTAYNKVRMHDVDMAGILYFPRQFRFAHDAFEDFVVESMSLTFNQLFRNLPYVFVIVHAEADYLRSVYVGDELRVELYIEKIGTTSFITKYNIFREEELTGTAQTIHVCLDAQTRSKVPLSKNLKDILEKYSKTTIDHQND